MEMKRQAVQYYNENQVPKELESLLNAMFFERPQDLYGYMVCVCVFFFFQTINLKFAPKLIDNGNGSVWLLYNKSMVDLFH